MRQCERGSREMGVGGGVGCELEYGGDWCGLEGVKDYR